MFSLVSIIIGVIFVMVIAGMITHMILFGTVLGLVAKRIAEASEQQRLDRAAQQPTPCGYCGATMPAGVVECPNCGGGTNARPA